MPWRLKREPLVLSVLLTAGFGCSQPVPFGADILARWGGGEIRRVELDDYVLTLPPKERAPGEGEDLAAWRRGLLRRLAARRILVERAQADVDTVVEELAAMAEDRVLAEAVAAVARAQMPAVSEDEIRVFYDDHPARFGRQELLDLRHLYLRFRDGELPAQRQVKIELARKLRRRALAGEDFAALVREHSDSANAGEGGSITLLARGHTFAAFEEVAFALEEGDLSEVFTSARGVHLIELDTRYPAFRKPLEDVREEIGRTLAERRLAEWLAAREVELAAAEPAEIHLERVRSETPAETVVVRVGDRRLTAAAFQRLHPQWREVGEGAGNRLEDFLRDDARILRFAGEAERQGLDQLPDVAARRRATRLRLLLRWALDRELDARRAVLTTSELRAFFDAHPDLFHSPRRIQASRIFLRCQPDEMYPTFLEAEGLVARIRTGEPFAELAREYSDGPLAAGGGQLPPLARKGLAAQGKEFYEAILELAPGDVSDPVSIPHTVLARGPAADFVGGILIVRADAVEEARPLAFDEALDRARKLYMRRHESEIRQRIEGDLTRTAGFEVNEALIGES